MNPVRLFLLAMLIVCSVFWSTAQGVTGFYGDELFRRFIPAVMNNSVNGQVPQYGPIRLAGDEGGEFIFLRRTE